MSGAERSLEGRAAVATSDHAAPRVHRSSQEFGTIVVVGGGCYGSWYVRQLGRACAAGAVRWQHLIVVDRDPACRVAVEMPVPGMTFLRSEWAPFFDEFLAAAEASGAACTDAIVPSPLMPHLLFDWLVGRARKAFRGRAVSVRPLRSELAVPWQRASADAMTHYVSFAEWMCPVNCIEPARCPATRGAREWSMPVAVRAHVEAERASGHIFEGPLVFHCTHRAYGVGMIDVRDVLAADREVATLSARGPADFLVGTVSHCHGALGVLSIAG